MSPILFQLSSKEVLPVLVLVFLGGILLLRRLCASCGDDGGENQQIKDSAPTEHDDLPYGCGQVQCLSNELVPATLAKNIVPFATAFALVARHRHFRVTRTFACVGTSVSSFWS